jgi:hypothetical protein
MRQVDGAELGESERAVVVQAGVVLGAVRAKPRPPRFGDDFARALEDTGADPVAGVLAIDGEGGGCNRRSPALFAD